MLVGGPDLRREAEIQDLRNRVSELDYEVRMLKLQVASLTEAILQLQAAQKGEGEEAIDA